MKILSEKIINDHYDQKAKRMTIAMDKEGAIARAEEERKKALSIFRKHGYLEVERVGTQWNIIEKKYIPQAKYDKANTKVITMKLNKGTDADILKKLEGVGNVQGYIKELIRNDIG